MKIFSGPTDRPPLSRAKAWSCLLVNAFVCPGLGSLMARRFSGWPQMVLAWGGGIVMIVVMIRFLAAYISEGQWPADSTYFFHAGLKGLAYFLSGWIWSVITGLLVLRQARSSPP